MKPACALPALLLAACALDAGSLRQETPPLTYTSRRSPVEVADCMARNMEKFLFAARSSIRPAGPGDALEVLARGADDSIYALAELRSADGGTAASMWFSPAIRMLRGPQETGMKFMLDC